MPFYKTKTCSNDIMTHSNLHRQSCYLKSICPRHPRLLPDEKVTKLELTNRFSGKNGILCRALEIENTHSFSVGKKFQLDDVIEAQQFDRDILDAIFQVARDMEKVEKNSLGGQILKGYLMATLFYEPSTRTRLSFESAMKRLGGEVLTTENAREFSSAAKGETLEGKWVLLLYQDPGSCSSSDLVVMLELDMQIQLELLRGTQT